MIQRREIRELSPRELWQYQQAVTELRMPNQTDESPRSVWEDLRDLYTRHIMHASDRRYFLLWHRVFLRYAEQGLQEANPSVSIPYYDVTTDAGDFRNAIIWQANHYGGNGDNGTCVKHHPFGNQTIWAPCIYRSFNTSVPIPSLLEVAQILKADDFQQLSEGLQALAGYLHTFIGGTMASSAAAYDPVFLSIYAYIDMLFWRWQKDHPDNSVAMASSDLSDLRLAPFGLTLKEAFNAEDVCVTYIPSGYGRPCNLTGVNLEIIPYPGYDADGFDSIGFDRFGYNREGNLRSSVRIRQAKLLSYINPLEYIKWLPY